MSKASTVERSLEEAAPDEAAPAQVILRPKRALPFFSGHPWVFASAVAGVEGAPQAGDEVLLCSHEREPIAQGLYNPHSHICVRLYGAAGDTPLDRGFWSLRLDQALALRRGLLGPLPDDGGRRLVFSESDQLSGLIVDWYAGQAVLHFTSLAMAMRRELFAELIEEKLRPAAVHIRLDREMRAAEGFDAAKGDFRPEGDVPAGGEAGPSAGATAGEPLGEGAAVGAAALTFVQEHGVRYGVDLAKGHKTGLYLDQRENRLAAARHMAGRRVLDLFCYTGGFGLAAVKLGGARQTLGVDSSAAAIVAAKANADLNGVADRVRFVRSEVFPSLERLRYDGARFDAIVLDPPKLAKTRAGVRNALRAYHSLNRLAVELLGEDGFLATCSCSGHVTRDMFEEMLSTVAAATGRRIQIIEARGQAPDHPVSVQCLESNYLKCYFCRVC